MRTRDTLKLMMLAVLGWTSGAQAAIVFSSDTGSELLGTWEAIGPTPTESLEAVAFAPLLPLGVSRIGLRVDNTIDFGTFGVGAPDNPFRSFAIPVADTVFAEVAGSFNNNPSGTNVFFRFSDLNYVVAGATFTGDFCFSTDAAGCRAEIPEPATLALAALGLFGAGMARRARSAR